MKEKHSDERLVEILSQVIRRFELENRVYAIVFDNINNMKILFEHIIKIYKSKHRNIKLISIELNTEHISCLAHIIQLALKSLMRNIKINSINS